MTAGSTDPAGGPFGGTVGFNVQNWGLVFGLEGDLAGNWMRNNTSSGTGICAVPGCTVQTSWFGTARGRVRLRFRPRIVLRHGGRRLRRCPDDGRRRNPTVERAGWTAGVGLEYGILGPWSAKIEYLYADLGNATCGAASCSVDTSVSFKTSIVRFGVNYRFW